MPNESKPNSIKVQLWKKRLNSQGYDWQGGYWGIGSPLYSVLSDDYSINETFRARDRDHAKKVVLAAHPNARFYR